MKKQATLTGTTETEQRIQIERLQRKVARLDRHNAILTEQMRVTQALVRHLVVTTLRHHEVLYPFNAALRGGKEITQ
jgi:hypothetical protein